MLENELAVLVRFRCAKRGATLESRVHAQSTTYGKVVGFCSTPKRMREVLGWPLVRRREDFFEDGIALERLVSNRKRERTRHLVSRNLDLAKYRKNSPIHQELWEIIADWKTTILSQTTRDILQLNWIKDQWIVQGSLLANYLISSQTIGEILLIGQA